MAYRGIEGKVALITGGTKGIGMATAMGLRKAGAKVAVNYSSDTSAAEKVLKELGGDENAIAIQADSGSVSGVEHMVQETVKKFGKIDILIANAGVMRSIDLEAATEKDFDHHFNINVKGVYFLIQKAVPHMAPGSRVIMVSTSLTANSAITPNYGLYVATKGAIEQMTRVLSKDLARKTINVNAVAPGPTGTELFFHGKSDELIKMIERQSPLNRLGKPEEQADVFLYLASDNASWVSGQVIRVNGAQT